MRLTTDGLIVKENNLGDNDRVVVVLTRDRGLVNAFVTGARRPKSRNAASTALLAFSNFVFYKNKETYNINEASPIEVFFDLRSDIEKLTVAQYICELCLELAPFEENAEDFLRLALNSLHFLCKKDIDVQKIKAVTELRMLCLGGYMPDIYECANCSKNENFPMRFDVNSGLIYCYSCANQGRTMAVDKTEYAAMKHIINAPFEKLYYFNIPHNNAVNLTNITEKYVLAQTGRRFKTLDFLHSMTFLEN